MSYVGIRIPAVRATKWRRPPITKEIRPLVINHIRESAPGNNIYIDAISGFTEHLHCLFPLNAGMRVAKSLQFIKGGSALNRARSYIPGQEGASSKEGDLSRGDGMFE